MFSILSNLTWPRFFGRAHPGAVSGFAMALAVAGSAAGPYLFSFGCQLAGSYAAPALACGVLGAGLAAAALRANRPVPPS